MRFYQLSKLVAFQLAATAIVIIAVLLAFANIFNWFTLPDSLSWISVILRIAAGLMLVGTWLLLNIPPPRLPNAKFIVVLAELGEEKGYDVGYDGKIKPSRRTLVSRLVNTEKYDEEYEPASSRTLEALKQEAFRRKQQSKTSSLAAMAGMKKQLFLAAPTSGSGLIASSGSSGLQLLTPDNKGLAVAGSNGHAADASGGLATLADDAGRSINYEPPPQFAKWEEVEGVEELSEYLQNDIQRKLESAGLFKDKPNLRSDAAVYPVDFVGDMAMAEIRYAQTKDLVPPGREEEKTKILVVIWGWNLHRSRRDFVPVFEMKEPIEEKYPLVNNFQLLGLKSFDLGVQNARSRTIFSGFVAGLCAYGSGNFAQACGDFNTALMSTYLYEAYIDTEIPGTGIDRSIIYFFLGNAYCLDRKYQDAANCYKKALDIDPYLFHARHNLALTQFLQGREDIAVQTLEKVENQLTPIDPEMATSQYNLGLALLANDDFADARQLLKKSLRGQPTNARAYRAMGASYFREEQRLHRNTIKDGQLFQPDERVFEESLHYLNKALEYDRNFAQVHVDLAELYYSRIKIHGLEPVKTTDGRGERVYASPAIAQQARSHINRAKDALRKATELDVMLPEAHYYAGFIEYSEGEVDQAAESLREAVILRPQYWEAHELLVLVYRSRGQNELAERELRLLADAGRIKLTSPRSHLDLGIGLLKNGQLDKARAEFETALRMEPRNVEALFQMGNVFYEENNWDDALKYYTQVQASPDAPDELFSYLSNTYNKIGNDTAALQVLQAAIDRRPRNAKLYYYLGKTYFTIKDIDKSLQSYIRSIELDPNMSEAHFNLGQLYLRRRPPQLRDANIQFRTTVDLNPTDADGWDWLGRTHSLLKETNEAINALERAIELKPEAIGARLTLGNIYLQQADSTAAIDQLRQILRYSPNEVKARELLGKAYAQAGDLTTAIETFQAILTIAPDSAEAHYNLGIAFVSQEKYYDAELEFRAFNQLKPTDADGYFNLGVALSRQDSDQKDLMAIEAFDKVIKLSPSKAADAYYQLGQLYFRYKDFEKGSKMIAEYTKLKGQGGN